MTVRKVPTVILGVAATIIFSLPAHAFLLSPFNVKYLLEKSTVVCKVQVTSLDIKGSYEYKSFKPPLMTNRILANVTVVSAIKGNTPKMLTIAYPAGTGSVSFTGLSKNEVCIVFLTEKGGEYTFTDIHNGKLSCVPTAVPYQFGGKPQDKMLSELLAECNSGVRRDQLHAVECLGELEDERASSLLEGFSRSSDLALRGVALAAMIQIGDVSKPETLLEYLDQDPAAFTSRIIRSLETRTRVAPLAGFDYITFYERAAESQAMRNSPTARSSMAAVLQMLADKRSIPLVQRLLDDSNAEVRYFAVTTLATIFKEESFPSFDTFKSNEGEYISYWKNKFQASK